MSDYDDAVIRDIIDNIIRREGGFSDHPNDRGGRTKYGVTQRTWNAYRAKHDPLLSPSSVRNIDVNDARQVYRTMYVEPLAWIEDEALLDLAADCAVNHGMHRATRWLQRAAGVEEDGIIGPVTRSGVNSEPDWCYTELLKIRLRFYVEIATDEFDKLELAEDSDLVFLMGWINRLAEFIE